MMIAAASEKMCDGNKDDSSESSSRKRIPKASAKDAQLDENPAANKGANDSEDDVRNASEPAAARNFSRTSGEPASALMQTVVPTGTWLKGQTSAPAHWPWAVSMCLDCSATDKKA